jgi:AP-1 complex subunit mu
MKVKPLFNIEVVVDNKSTAKIDFMIKVKSNFKQKSSANNVDMFIPVPEDAEHPTFKGSTGTMSYAPEKEAI